MTNSIHQVCFNFQSKYNKIPISDKLIVTEEYSNRHCDIVIKHERHSINVRDSTYKINDVLYFEPSCVGLHKHHGVKYKSFLCNGSDYM
jgi:hypothetical protein